MNAGAEGAPWTPFSFERYMQWFSMYLGLHLDSGKPLIIEEFNVQVGVQTEQQRNALFKWLTDQLVASKKSGGPLAGIMYWEAAVSGIEDYGYNIYMRRRLQAKLAASGDRRSLRDRSPNTTSSDLLPDMHTSDTAVGSDARDDSTATARLQRSAMLPEPVHDRLVHTKRHHRHLTDVPIGSAPEQLDAFRRYSQQRACEQALVATWRPTEPPQVVDVSAYMSEVSGKNVLDIIRDAAQAVL
ncbi:MAG: hypothetical protein WDW38_002076 [Sanguina aurantia]